MYFNFQLWNRPKPARRAIRFVAQMHRINIYHHTVSSADFCRRHFRNCEIECIDYVII